MNIKKIIIVSVLFVTSLFLIGCSNEKQNADSGVMMPSTLQKADKIEVIHFHATQQCWSCIIVGQYALKTIRERFPEEYKNRKITFRDINGDLPENRDIVMMYQARGSSLFLNVIINGQNHITEDVSVWRLIGNEKIFKDYFEGKLKELSG